METDNLKTCSIAEKTIHELFEKQVNSTPHQVAIYFRGQEITYKELNEKANQMGNILRELGIGHESLVAISLEPSIELIAALLGVLKAGGAYVPLDPSYPNERLKFIVEDI